MLIQIITATETHPSSHSSHSCGVYAILSTKSAPLDLLNWGNRFQISNPLLLDGPLKVRPWYLCGTVTISDIMTSYRRLVFFVLQRHTNPPWVYIPWLWSPGHSYRQQRPCCQALQHSWRTSINFWRTRSCWMVNSQSGQPASPWSGDRGRLVLLTLEKLHVRKVLARCPDVLTLILTVSTTSLSNPLV